MTYDAIVIGAGPAGSTCALRLARAGWRVAIAEKAKFPRRKVCGEFVSAPALGLLERAGVSDITTLAGPEIREIAIYAGEKIVHGTMPRADGSISYGRAIGRDKLDAHLLDAARGAGAKVWQACRVKGYERAGGEYVCDVESKEISVPSLRARLVIAAHGSWDTGRIAPGPARRTSGPSDLFAFKARFTNGVLARGTMPLLAFPGGYGGLVTSDSEEVSFSCCITREALSRCRSSAPGASAGDAVLAHASRSCRGLRAALQGATRAGPWLAVGPLRMGFHARSGDGVFAIGNAMAEAHPIVAEGISMAIQSSALLAERLVEATPQCADWTQIARSYDAAYRANFRGRIMASAAFAQVAMKPGAARAVATLMERAPALLQLGARWAGKAAPLNASA